MKPPVSVQRNAKRGLLLRKKFGRGGTAIGVARARDLSNGKNVSDNTIARMVSYFARHAVDKDAKGSESAGYWGKESNPSAGWIAWLLWGGDAGRRWANAMWKKIRDKSESYAVSLLRVCVAEGTTSADISVFTTKTLGCAERSFVQLFYKHIKQADK